MSASEPMTAEILESSSAGFAAAANAELQSRAGAGGERDSKVWQVHLQQRILELAAALRVGEPQLFTGRIAWLRRAAAARSNDDHQVVIALESLHQALKSELPQALRSQALAVIEQALSEARHPIASEPSALDPSTPTGKLGLEYIAACLDPSAGDPIAMIMQAVDEGMPPQQIYCGVLLPVQKEIGQLWHVGDFSVAEERLVSETTRRVMTLLAARFKPKAANGKTMLAASVAGNTHDLGLRMASDLFALAGWYCLFLGANVPTAEIAGAVEEFDVDLVVLTATLTTQLNPLADAIAEINHRSPETRVLVGGIALDGSDETWRRMGADGFAPRIDEAVALGEALLEKPVERRPPERG
jgi:methanogenic corrinoid protein MtbC1